MTPGFSQSGGSLHSLILFSRTKPGPPSSPLRHPPKVTRDWQLCREECQYWDHQSTAPHQYGVSHETGPVYISCFIEKQTKMV